MHNNHEEQIKNLLAFSQGMMQGKNGANLIKNYEETIKNVTPQDILIFQDMLVQMNYPAAELKNSADKLINVFYKYLNLYQWEKPKESTFLYYLMKENEGLRNKLESIKKIILRNDIEGTRNELAASFEELKEIDGHYIKKENILFPYLEKKMERHGALKIMWSLHDDVRKNLKELINMLEHNNSSDKELKVLIGKVFFLMYGVAQKEELILFPAASDIVSEKEWDEMLIQSFDYPFSFIETPPKPKELKNPITEFKDNLIFKSETGNLALEEILMIFSKLPIDITYVDENNKVRFFSKSDKRIFPRSPAAIGRDVKNCHPPESVHMVEKIIDALRKGEKDSAQFWINLKGKVILIQYFALRNDKNEYKGVLEASQDITEIKALEGEKRLLDWK